jgi:hypothetical protein
MPRAVLQHRRTIARFSPAFYVHPTTGHNGNSGRYGAPVASLASAIGAAAAYMQWGSAQPSITLLDDVYLNGAQVQFDETNTGINGKTLTLEALDATHGSISAGAVVSGFTLFSAGIYRAAYNGNAPLNVYVDGVRYSQASRGSGLSGTVGLTGTGYTSTSDGILTDPNPSHIRLGYYGTFLRPQNRVIGVAGNAISMVALAHTRITDEPGFAYHFWDDFLTYDNAAHPSYVWNVKADFMLGTQQTFYCDTANGFLYICPLTGHDLSVAKVIASTSLETPVIFDGASDVTVTNHVRIEHADYSMALGFAERSMGTGYFDSDHTPVVTGPLSGPGAGDYTNLDQSAPLLQSLPAAVVIRDSTRINFTEYVRIQHHAALGVSFEGLNSDCELYGIAVDDVGSLPIRIGNNAQALDSACSDNIRIQHCKISNGGREFKTGTGIHDCFMSNSLIAHCEIYNMPYNGIASAVGATINFSWWDKRVGNAIRFNLVHDVMTDLVDGAGIYASGTDHDDLEIEGNYVYNVGNALAFPGTLVFSPFYIDQFGGHKVLTNNVGVARSGQPILLVNDNATPNHNRILTNYGNTGTVQVIGNAPDTNTAFTVNADVLSISAAATIAAAAGPAEPYRSQL